jgi:hypothetical protein
MWIARARGPGARGVTSDPRWRVARGAASDQLQSRVPPGCLLADARVPSSSSAPALPTESVIDGDPRTRTAFSQLA